MSKKKTRAKFNVTEIARYGNDGGSKVTLLPVRDSDENKALWTGVPNGSIQLFISNPKLEFEFGEYYIDFTKAD